MLYPDIVFGNCYIFCQPIFLFLFQCLYSKAEKIFTIFAFSLIIPVLKKSYYGRGGKLINIINKQDYIPFTFRIGQKVKIKKGCPLPPFKEGDLIVTETFNIPASHCTCGIKDSPENVFSHSDECGSERKKSKHHQDVMVMDSAGLKKPFSGFWLLPVNGKKRN